MRRTPCQQRGLRLQHLTANRNSDSNPEILPFCERIQDVDRIELSKTEIPSGYLITKESQARKSSENLNSGEYRGLLM
jgi:hypothetical protein